MGCLFFLGIIPLLLKTTIWLGLAAEIGWYAFNTWLYRRWKKHAGPEGSFGHGTLRLYQRVMFYTLPLQILGFATLVVAAIETFRPLFGIDPMMATDLPDFLARLHATAIDLVVLFSVLYVAYALPGWAAPSKTRKRNGFVKFVVFPFMIMIGLALGLAAWFGSIMAGVFLLRALTSWAVVASVAAFLFLTSVIFMRLAVGGAPDGESDPWGLFDKKKKEEPTPG